MSRENIEIIQRGFDAFQRGDLQTVLAAGDPGVVVENHAVPEALTYEGLDGALSAITDWVDAFEDFRVEIDELVDSGDDVLVVTRQRGQGRDSGAPVESRFGMLFSFRDGAVVRWRIYADLDEARAALGEPA
jgi:ketosteroid isomerase-like protein